MEYLSDVRLVLRLCELLEPISFIHLGPLPFSHVLVLVHWWHVLFLASLHYHETFLGRCLREVLANSELIGHSHIVRRLIGAQTGVFQRILRDDSLHKVLDRRASDRQGYTVFRPAGFTTLTQHEHLRRVPAMLLREKSIAAAHRLGNTAHWSAFRFVVSFGVIKARAYDDNLVADIALDFFNVGW